MSKAEFDKFIQRQQIEEDEVAPINPAEQVEEWRQYLELLYGNIEQYMHQYIDTGSAKIEYQEIELNEEFSGPYRISQMTLKIGRSTITFKPIGTMLIGSKGRVDVQGPRGSSRLVLMNKKVTNVRQLFHVAVTTTKPGAPPPNHSPIQSQDEGQRIEWSWKIVSPPPEMTVVNLNQDAFFNMIMAIADA